VQAVLDPNVLISALLSPKGSPAQVLRAWEAGEFELIVSEALLAELERALAYPKLRRLLSSDDAAAAVAWIRGSATMRSDPTEAPDVRSEDPGDDYLIALAATETAWLVSGDGHLLQLEGDIPSISPRRFLDKLNER
jgi:putative PIN family toxin of toxin-antitoxin system